MTKKEVADQISKKVNITAEQSMAAVESFMKIVKNAVKENDPVTLRGFGTFMPKKYAAKKARNISKGTIINVPARVIPAFKPSDEFKKMLY